MASRGRVIELRSQADQDGDEPERASGPAVQLPRATTGRLVGWTNEGLLVDFAGNTAGPLVARTVVDFRRAQIEEMVKKGSTVLLVFEDGDVQRPIVVGALRSLPQPAVTPSSLGVSGIEVDGERVEVVARDEVVLRCGEASITLRRNGRVVIKGAYVETRARGTNRIKGGNVLIN